MSATTVEIVVAVLTFLMGFLAGVFFQHYVDGLLK